MTVRRPTTHRDLESAPTAAPRATDVGIQPRSPVAEPPGAVRSGDEAEARYVAARDVWTAAMRSANSGRPAELATLAVAQEDFESATAELQRWRRGERVPIPVEPERARGSIDVIVGHELAWRRLREQQPQPHGGGLLRRIANRFGKR